MIFEIFCTFKNNIYSREVVSVYTQYTYRHNSVLFLQIITHKPKRYTIKKNKNTCVEKKYSFLKLIHTHFISYTH